MSVRVNGAMTSGDAIAVPRRILAARALGNVFAAPHHTLQPVMMRKEATYVGLLPYLIAIGTHIKFPTPIMREHAVCRKDTVEIFAATFSGP